MQRERKAKNFIRKPVYPGGPSAMRALISKNLRYPAQALEQKTEGTVRLRYTIDHSGKVIDTQIIAGIGHGCDEEADRLVRMLRFDVPKNRGVKVQFHHNINIHFRLPKQKKVTQKVSVQYQYTTQPSSSSPSYQYTLTIPKKPPAGEN